MAREKYCSSLFIIMVEMEQRERNAENKEERKEELN